MTQSDENQFTISIADISTSLGVSRTTLWRLFHGQEMSHTRYAGAKHFAVSDVIARLRQRSNHNPETETTLLQIDKQRRHSRQHEAHSNGI